MTVRQAAMALEKCVMSVNESKSEENGIARAFEDVRDCTRGDLEMDNGSACKT